MAGRERLNDKPKTAVPSGDFAANNTIAGPRFYLGDHSDLGCHGCQSV